MDLWKKWQKAFDLPALFDEVQKEYGEFYDYIVAKGQEKINLLLIIIYVISVVFTGLALFVNFKIISSDNQIVQLSIEIMLVLAVIIYPVYVLFKSIKKLFMRPLDTHSSKYHKLK